MTLYISQTSQYLGNEKKKWLSYLSGTAGGVFDPSIVGGGGLAGGLDCCNSIPNCTAAWDWGDTGDWAAGDGDGRG